MAVPMASSAKVVTFGAFQCSVASFCVAGVAFGDIQICQLYLLYSFKASWAKGV